ncbi:hypothetical protein GGF45_002563, partial [Coemansia sp. RSA 551]
WPVCRGANWLFRLRQAGSYTWALCLCCLISCSPTRKSTNIQRAAWPGTSRSKKSSAASPWRLSSSAPCSSDWASWPLLRLARN